MYKKISDPKTLIKYNINSHTGKKIITKYLNFLKGGGVALDAKINEHFNIDKHITELGLVKTDVKSDIKRRIFSLIEDLSPHEKIQLLTLYIGFKGNDDAAWFKKYVKFINSQDIVQQIKSFIGKNLIGDSIKTIDIDVDEVDILGATDIIIGNTNSDYIKSLENIIKHTDTDGNLEEKINSLNSEYIMMIRTKIISNFKMFTTIGPKIRQLFSNPENIIIHDNKKEIKIEESGADDDFEILSKEELLQQNSGIIHKLKQSGLLELNQKGGSRMAQGAGLIVTAGLAGLALVLGVGVGTVAGAAALGVIGGTAGRRAINACKKPASTATAKYNVGVAVVYIADRKHDAVNCLVVARRGTSDGGFIYDIKDTYNAVLKGVKEGDLSNTYRAFAAAAQPASPVAKSAPPGVMPRPAFGAPAPVSGAGSTPTIAPALSNSGLKFKVGDIVSFAYTGTFAGIPFMVTNVVVGAQNIKSYTLKIRPGHVGALAAAAARTGATGLNVDASTSITLPQDDMVRMKAYPGPAPKFAVGETVLMMDLKKHLAPPTAGISPAFMIQDMTRVVVEDISPRFRLGGTHYYKVLAKGSTVETATETRLWPLKTNPTMYPNLNRWDNHKELRDRFIILAKKENATWDSDILASFFDARYAPISATGTAPRDKDDDEGDEHRGLRNVLLEWLHEKWLVGQAIKSPATKHQDSLGLESQLVDAPNVAIYHTDNHARAMGVPGAATKILGPHVASTALSCKARKRADGSVGKDGWIIGDVDPAIDYFNCLWKMHTNGGKWTWNMQREWYFNPTAPPAGATLFDFARIRACNSTSAAPPNPPFSDQIHTHPYFSPGTVNHTSSNTVTYNTLIPPPNYISTPLAPVATPLAPVATPLAPAFGTPNPPFSLVAPGVAVAGQHYSNGQKVQLKILASQLGPTKWVPATIVRYNAASSTYDVRLFWGAPITTLPVSRIRLDPWGGVTPPGAAAAPVAGVTPPPPKYKVGQKVHFVDRGRWVPGVIFTSLLYTSIPLPPIAGGAPHMYNVQAKTMMGRPSSRGIVRRVWESLIILPLPMQSLSTMSSRRRTRTPHAKQTPNPPAGQRYSKRQKVELEILASPLGPTKWVPATIHGYHAASSTYDVISMGAFVAAIPVSRIRLDPWGGVTPPGAAAAPVAGVTPPPPKYKVGQKVHFVDRGSWHAGVIATHDLYTFLPLPPIAGGAPHMYNIHTTTNVFAQVWESLIILPPSVQHLLYPTTYDAPSVFDAPPVQQGGSASVTSGSASATSGSAVGGSVVLFHGCPYKSLSWMMNQGSVKVDLKHILAGKTDTSRVGQTLRGIIGGGSTGGGAAILGDGMYVSNLPEDSLTYAMNAVRGQEGGVVLELVIDNAQDFSLGKYQKLVKPQLRVQGTPFVSNQFNDMPDQWEQGVITDEYMGGGGELFVHNINLQKSKIHVFPPGTVLQSFKNPRRYTFGFNTPPRDYATASGDVPVHNNHFHAESYFSRWPLSRLLPTTF